MKTVEVLAVVLKGKRVKENTKRHYNDALRSLAGYSEEWPSSGMVVDEWIGTLDGYADASVRNWYNFVNSAGKYVQRAYGQDTDGSWKVPNPCENASRPKVSKKRRRYFTAEEIWKVIGACRFEQDKLLIATLIDSTCRIGELVGLEVGQVGDNWLDLHGKTGQRRYRCASQICDRLRQAGADNKPIFPDRNGDHASVSSLKHRVRRVMREAGLTGSKLGAHTLRHSGASMVAQETGSALVVKALLQHDKIDTSMEYIHDVEDALQQGISPLKLVLDKYEDRNGTGAIRQLTMGESGEAVEFVEVEGESSAVDDMLDEIFPDIKDGTVVHSRLKDTELRLLVRASIGYIRSGSVGTEEAELKALFRRMMRKVH